MRVFVAGASGAIGQPLVPKLVAAGHEVTGMTRSESKAEAVRQGMLRAFELAGYTEDEVRQRFGGLVNAFRYGPPPHGGCAAGIDRIVMLLAGAENIREVIMFPMNQRAEDLMMGAPSEATNEQLRELGIRLIPRD